jgi:sigma-E factor negative regulatory protein RseC
MIEEQAVVISSEGAFARVEARRSNVCGPCGSKSVCGVSALAKLFGKRRGSLRVRNPIGAGPGDRVVVGLDESVLTTGSFVIYIVPLLTLVIFAVVGQWLAGVLAFESAEPMAIAGGLLGLWLGLSAARSYTSRTGRDDRYHAVILRKESEFTVELSNGGR